MLGEMGGRLRLLPILALSAVLVGACANEGVRFRGPDAPDAAAVSPLPPLNSDGQPVVAVVERVQPSVVNVTTDLFRPGAPGETVTGTGTGFVVRSDGVVVTNFHVVEGAANIQVTTADGTEFEARVIGGAQELDLAVLKVDGDDLPTVDLGDSDVLELGETVVAIGFPLRLEGGPSVTAGIVSAKERTIQAQGPGGDTRTLEDLIQTDAAINPGNSGGPLVSLSGRVVGINTAGIQPGAAENIGFAIAINRVQPIIDRAIEDPEAPVAYLGVSTQDVDALVAAQLDLPVDRGALVLDILPGGPADQAGMQGEDVILRIGERDIETGEDVRDAVLEHSPDERVDVVVIRDGDEQRLTVTLGTRPLPVSAG
jgi:serine protease Do